MCEILFGVFLEENGLVMIPEAELIIGPGSGSICYRIGGYSIFIYMEDEEEYCFDDPMGKEYGPFTFEEALDELNNLEQDLRFMFYITYGMEQIPYTRTY